MGQPRRRISYVLPSPIAPTPRLQLPPHGASRLGLMGPLLTQYSGKEDKRADDIPRQPRHRLGVASLALDCSTALVGRNSPEGILYSGGRDGLIMAWDLGVPMKTRKLADSGGLGTKRAKWEALTGWGDDVIEEETSDGDELPFSDGDVLGEVRVNSRRRANVSQETPHERQWESDLSAFEPRTKTKFRQCAQAHTDWVNDILLCNYNQTVVSASSDGTVKAWNPHASNPTDPAIIGTHNDYVRCLTSCREQNWIASGSFDRTIKLWDLYQSSSDPLVTLNPPDATAAKSSVYSIAADPFGRIIASGSPERVIRLWDPRTGKRTGKLVGHTDNIRSILISEDSKYLLTGSADASIKLWSLSTQRCLHTFAHHEESVWALYSNHPSLEVFYSGDKSGLVCRVDVEGCSDLSEGECILLCNDSSGESTRSSSEGINKIMVMADNLLWTASGTSNIRRWHIPQRRMVRAPYSPPPVPEMDGDRLSPTSISHAFKRRADAPSEPNSRPSTAQGFSRRISFNGSVRSLSSEHHDLDLRMNGLPYETLIKLISPNGPLVSYSASLNRARDPEVATMYSAASIVSVPRHIVRPPSQNMFYSSTFSSPLPTSRTEDGTMMVTNTARAMYEERDLAAEATPLCTEPDIVIQGDHGLVRSIILNDRVHALTVNTAGEVAVWDIVRGVCLGRYYPEDVAAASHTGSSGNGSGEIERSPREALEAVRERIEGEGVSSSWCTADTKTGVLTIHLTEKSFDAEVYADEVGFANNQNFNEDSKLNIGKWVLRNLFIGFIEEEEIRLHQASSQDGPTMSRTSSPDPLVQRAPSRHQAKHEVSNITVICSPSMPPAIPHVITSTVRRSPLLPPLIPIHPQSDTLSPLPHSAADGKLPNVQPQGPRKRSGTVESLVSSNILPTPASSKEDSFAVRGRGSQSAVSPNFDDFSGWTGPNKTEPQTPSTPGGLIGRLKFFGKITKRPVSDVPTSTNVGLATPATPGTTTPAGGGPIPKTPLQKLLAGPFNPPLSADGPLVSIPTNTTILISEEAQPSYSIIYRGTLSNIPNDVDSLEAAMPMWVLEYLLKNQAPHSAPLTKLAFVLLPWNKDPDETLPDLLNVAQNKLTASRYLRIRKIVSHVQDKLERMMPATGLFVSTESHIQENVKPPRPRAEDEYEILCNETLLPLGMCLAAVRQYVWRQGAELIMHYRKKRQTITNKSPLR